MPRGSGIRASSGKAGEQAAELWFRMHGWRMVRTQPAVEILAHMDKPALRAVARVLNKPRLAFFGHLFLVRVAGGGVFDYTGYVDHVTPQYVACEVKEARGKAMPCSRLDGPQIDWGSELPASAAFVGILWVDGQSFFEIHRFKARGSYVRGEGQR